VKKDCMILVNYALGWFSWACHIREAFNVGGLNYCLFYIIHAMTCSSGIGIMKVGQKNKRDPTITPHSMGCFQTLNLIWNHLYERHGWIWNVFHSNLK
jgi:hypothetical protein